MDSTLSKNNLLDDKNSNSSLVDHQASETEDYGFLPIKYHELAKYYYDQRNLKWSPPDVDLREDRADYDLADEDTQTLVDGLLAFFVPSDGMVEENLFRNFQQDTSFWKEAGFFYAEQSSMEIIHSEMYSLMAKTIVRDQEKLKSIFDSIKTYPSVKRISEFMKKYMDRKYSLAERIIAFACVEGVLFTSAFASIYWIKKRNILRGFCKANEFIARDEGIHTKFAVTLYLLACKEQKMVPASEDRAQEIVKEAVEVGSQFIRDILRIDRIGMSINDLIDYTKCTADELLCSTGHSKVYNVMNPLDWMAVISLPNKTNFFEDKVSEYTQQTESEFVFDEDAYF